MKVATYTTFCIVFLSANMFSGTDIFTSFVTNSFIEVRIKLGEVIITTSRVGTGIANGRTSFFCDSLS